MTSMRTVLNILNFVLGGFFTTLGWLIATVFSVLLVITLPLTRSCWGNHQAVAGAVRQ